LTGDKKAQEAASEGLTAEIGKLGLDPSDPAALGQLPPDARERIRTRAAIAFAASGGSNKAASQVVERATKNAGMSELERESAEAVTSETLQTLITSPAEER